MFSRTNAMVRQLIRSAIRDWAVCRIGALCPSSRPATTTAITPEAWISSARDVRRERHDQRDPGVEDRVGDVAAHLGHQQERREARPRRRRTAASSKSAPTSSTPRAAHAHAAGRDRGAQRDQGGRVVEQRLALEDRDDPARQPDPAADRGRRHGVGRRDDRADRERQRPAEVRQQRVRDHRRPRRR